MQADWVNAVLNTGIRPIVQIMAEQSAQVLLFFWCNLTGLFQEMIQKFFMRVIKQCWLGKLHFKYSFSFGTVLVCRVITVLLSFYY